MTEKQFKEISPFEITDNPFSAFAKDWALLAAGDREQANMMTIGWAAFGVLWNRNVVFAFSRPQRHTYAFLEREEKFSVGFFEERHREALKFCGSVSGKDRDKIKESGLTLRYEGAVPCFAEARLTVTCRKIYTQDLDPARFLDATIDKNYPLKDYHRMYVGEIEKVLIPR